MSSPPLTQLTTIHNLLTLTSHRNKNQHRLAKWWKPFSQLRRHVGKLISELEISESYTALSAKSKKTDEARDRVEKRVMFMEGWLVERCYSAFSNVVADNQYAPLGLVLLGILARTSTTLRGLRREKPDEEDEQEVQEVGVLKEKDAAGLVNSERDDLGEVVARGDVVLELRQDVGQEEKPPGVRHGEADQGVGPEQKEGGGKQTKESFLIVTKEGTARRPKKRKKRDAFDDLFDSLI